MNKFTNKLLYIGAIRTIFKIFLFGAAVNAVAFVPPWDVPSQAFESSPKAPPACVPLLCPYKEEILHKIYIKEECPTKQTHDFIDLPKHVYNSVLADMVFHLRTDYVNGIFKMPIKFMADYGTDNLLTAMGHALLRGSADVGSVYLLENSGIPRPCAKVLMSLVTSPLVDFSLYGFKKSTFMYVVIYKMIKGYDILVDTKDCLFG